MISLKEKLLFTNHARISFHNFTQRKNSFHDLTEQKNAIHAFTKTYLRGLLSSLAERLTKLFCLTNFKFYFFFFHILRYPLVFIIILFSLLL